MPRRRIRAAAPTALLLCGALTLAACGGEDEEPTAAPSTQDATGSASEDEADEPQDETTPTDDEASAVGGADDPVCSEYLEFIDMSGPRDGEALTNALEDVGAPPATVDAVATLGSPDADVEEIFAAVEELAQFAVGRCAEFYAADLDPADSDTAALEQLREALIAGDESMAAPIATKDVLSTLRPWDGFRPESQGGDATYSISGSSLSASLMPTVTVFCEAEGGVVVSCVFGE